MAFCAHCGKEISPQAPACPQCGHPNALAVRSAAPAPDAFAIASLVCAIGGLTLIPVIGSILGIVFGKVAKDRITSDPAIEGASLARAGTIIGWVGLVIGVLMILAVIVWINAVKATFHGPF